MAKIPAPIEFDWDSGNIDKSWEKHGINYKQAEEVFSNKPLKIFLDPKHSQIEERFVAYGKTNTNKTLTIIFTIRQNKIRVISARGQNKKERSKYEEKTENHS